jgi:hypothetical protein
VFVIPEISERKTPKSEKKVRDSDPEGDASQKPQ